MILAVNFEEVGEGPVRQYLRIVKDRNSEMPLPLWNLHARHFPLEKKNQLVVFCIDYNLPINIFIIGGQLAGIAGGLFIWKPLFLVSIIFTILGIFTTPSFFYWGLKKGWRKMSNTKTRKVSSEKALKSIVKNVADRRV